MTLAVVAKPSRPNIPVVLTDDLGWTDLRTPGVRKDLRTPNLDALAVGGLFQGAWGKPMRVFVEARPGNGRVVFGAEVAGPLE